MVTNPPGPPLRQRPRGTWEADAKQYYDDTVNFLIHTMGQAKADAESKAFDAMMKWSQELRSAGTAQASAAIAPAASGAAAPKQTCTIATLDTHMTYAARKIFLGGFKPLTETGVAVPQPADLTDFWSTVELSLRAIDSSVSPELLGHRAIELLGPLILGPAGWAVIERPSATASWEGTFISPISATASGAQLPCWANFKSAVDRCFGLSLAQKKARFFKLQRKANQKSEDFVVHVVEEARVRLPALDQEAVYLAFGKQLDGELARRVQSRQEHKDMEGSGTVTWQEVVRAAREMQVLKQGGSIVGEQTSQATAAVSPGPAAPGPVAPVAVPVAKPVAAAAYHAPLVAAMRGTSSGASCPLCKQLGGPFQHRPDLCFIDPKSPVFKPEVRARRLAAAVAKGIPIPQAVVDQKPEEALPPGATIAPCPVATKPATVTAGNNSAASPTSLAGWLGNPMPSDDALSSTLEDARAGLQMLGFTKDYVDSAVGEMVAQWQVGSAEAGPEGGLLMTGGECGAQISASTSPMGLVGAVSSASGLPSSWIDELIRHYSATVGTPLLAPTAEAGTQTRVSGRSPGKAPADLNSIVGRLRMSVPLLQRTIHDGQLRAIVLASLVRQCTVDGQGVVLMDQTPIQVVTPEVFRAYQDCLSGLNTNNVREVEARLGELNIGPSHTVRVQAPPPPPTQVEATQAPQPAAAAAPQAAATPTPEWWTPYFQRAATASATGQPSVVIHPPPQQPQEVSMQDQAGQAGYVAAAALGAQLAAMQIVAPKPAGGAHHAVIGSHGDMGSATFPGFAVHPVTPAVPKVLATAPVITQQASPRYVKEMPKLRPVPLWAAQLGLVDMRGTLVWDSSQEVIEIGVGNKLTLGVVDTGAHQTVMDVAMATALGMEVYMAQNGDCGKYSVAGGPQLDYAGRVSKPVVLRFGEGVAYSVTGLRLIHHAHPLMLIGHDVLKSGRPENQWSYVGEDREQKGGVVRGYLKFSGDHKIVRCPLYWVPSEGTEPFTNRPKSASPAAPVGQRL